MTDVDRAAPLLTVVIPVYGNEGSIRELVAALTALAEGLDEPIECVFVVDASPDQSRALLAEHLAGAPFRAVVADHTRNFGSFAAIRSGLALGRGELFGVMAADLQEPPELMEAFAARLQEGDVQVVIGRRETRDGDRRGDRVSSDLYWRAYRRFVMPSVPPGGADVFACTREVRDRLLELEESNSSLVGLLFWLGYDTAEVAYERRPRADGGTSAWTFRKKVRYMMDSIYSFTDLPLRTLRAIGLTGLLLSVFASLVVAFAWWRGNIDVPGYTPLILTILISTMSILSALGIVGSYVWRAFENTKRRPLSVVERIEVVEP